MKNAMSVLGIRGHKGQNSTGTRSPRFLALESRCRGFFITGHKGQNSKGTRCRGFLALASRCRGFSVLEPRCRGFLSSEKTTWNHDVVDYFSPFLIVVVLLFPNLDVTVFWYWNLGVVVFWSLNPDVVVYVPPRPRFCYHRENKKVTHNCFNYVVEKYFSCPNLCNIYLHNVCISELE